MITRQDVANQLLAYLNGELSLEQLVDRAENMLVQGGFSPDDDVDLLMDIVMYLAAADTEYFPLTWEICSEFMQTLGTPVRVVPTL
jgi:hypothetical protein